MGHKHDYLDLEVFCNSHNVVAAAAVVVVVVVAAAAAAVVVVVVVAAAAVDVAVAAAAAAVAVDVAVEEACFVLDRRLEHLGPLILRWEEIFFGRSLPYVDHEVVK